MGSSHQGIVRKGFGLKKEVAGDLNRDYQSELVDRARESEYKLAFPDLTVRIAKEFGFCYGVERAIDYAYEARMRFPDKQLFLTGEIIHNPKVNRRLREIGYEFLDGTHGSTLGWDDVGPEDVVLIPAFGVTIALLEKMRATGALLVDTTCGSVLNVWKNVERFAREGFTCLIHGKWDHEETRATASRALLHAEGRYVMVRDLDEAQAVADYIESPGDHEAFVARFGDACSNGFDPDRDLARVGMANQTTMLSSESLRIADLIRDALASRFGENELAERFRAFDTICSATEDRQQAVRELLEEPLDLMIVIGGYNSSNTGHLAALCQERVPTYHVAEPDELLSISSIRHRDPSTKTIVETAAWLPERPVVIGVTAGASTPDREIGAVITRLLELRGRSLEEQI